MGWHGSFNWLRNYANGTIRRLKQMAANLHPLEEVALERLKNWLPKLSNPVRIGEHDQTAFALGLMLDYAHGNGDQNFAELVVSKAKQFYLSDKNCPLAYEPSGEDFLSSCLGEADLMRRVLPSQEFAGWLRIFMPQLSLSGNDKWLQPVVSPDPSDPKLAHLDGPHLSRAWMLEGIAAGLAKNDKRRPSIMASAEAHRRAGLAAVTGEHYEGGTLGGKLCCFTQSQNEEFQRRPDKEAMLTEAPPQKSNRDQFLESERMNTLDLSGRRLPSIAPWIESAIKAGKNAAVRRASAEFLDTASEFYGVPECGIRVLAARPLRVRERGTFELFGDYTPETMLIRVWMRTAVRREVTSFGTFLSTLCHEFCHHLDFKKFGFQDSWHTRGFYERAAVFYHHARATPRKKLFWVPLAGGRWRIDWQRTNRSGSTILPVDRSPLLLDD